MYVLFVVEVLDILFCWEGLVTLKELRRIECAETVLKKLRWAIQEKYFRNQFVQDNSEGLRTFLNNIESMEATTKMTKIKFPKKGVYKGLIKTMMKRKRQLSEEEIQIVCKQLFEGRKFLRQTTEMKFVVDKDFTEDEDKFDEGNLIYFPDELIEILACKTEIEVESEQ